MLFFRPITCNYELLGCDWKGPFHQRTPHEAECTFPSKSGSDLLSFVQSRKETELKEFCAFKDIFDLLSFDKISFSGWSEF